MKKEEVKDLLDKAEKKLEEEPNLIELGSGTIVFVGDTHGDFDATQKVIDRYLRRENTLVFLGDYVDRGSASADNINTLLSLKLENPDNLYLLMGNHEGRRAMEFHPADFWDRLDKEMHERYSLVLSKLPLAVSALNGVIGLHGVLPDIERIDGINQIAFGSKQWHWVVWGDWRESEGDYLGEDMFTGRPQFGQGWFEGVMERLGKNVLIRSHQPSTRQAIYGGRCVTIFTSSAYRSIVPDRTIAIAEAGKEVKTVGDLKIEVV
ncbi:MAG: metallophosphoesterase family protein [Dehalococcoidia bacterium]